MCLAGKKVLLGEQDNMERDGFYGNVNEGDLRVEICRLHRMEENTDLGFSLPGKDGRAYTIRFNYTLLCLH